MKKVPLRTLALVGLAGALLCACGGKAVVGGTSGSSGSGGSSSGGSSGSSATGGSSGAGGSCVNVDLSTYDQSCNQASDCVYINSGEVCDGQCLCGDALINASGLARYRQAIASIQMGMCACMDKPAPQCIGHQCTSCIDVDLSTYDQTCKVDSDCTEVTSGQICSGACACGGSAINVDGEARYQAFVASVETLACPCPADGVPRCIQNHCTLCGVGPHQPVGCGDGG